MCGIAGYVGEGDTKTLERMADTLRHRGPDDRGTMEKGNIGLAHTRLSILDTSANGHQPMESADGAVAIVFNGEIYNFPHLRKELEFSGMRFRSDSDTEVIIALYQRDGEACFSKLEGMFAIALYDFSKRKLILCRDRFGKKPLYWMRRGKTVIFASELKALRHHPAWDGSVDLASVQKFLSYEYVPTPHTIFEDVHKLDPATYIVFEDGSARDERFWELERREEITDEREALKELDRLLEDAVRDRLISDVPLGVFLSGGIDSSTIAYYAKKLSPNIHTFSIGFEDAGYDESPYAALVAKHIGTSHHVRILKEQDALSLIPDLLPQIDEPFADSSVIPTYLLSGFAREEITVALGGDGGDELFMGYPTFQAGRVAPWYRMLPQPIRRSIMEPAIRRIPPSFGHLAFDEKAQKFIQGFSGDARHMHQHWLESFSRSEQGKLFADGAVEALSETALYEDRDRWLTEAASAGLSGEAAEAYAYLRTYLMDGVLVKVDRASMLKSLEVRAPILDHRLVEFTFSLSDDLKLKGFQTKYILKKLMKERLPKEIVYRKKKGFGMPIGAWMRKELREYVDDTLSKSAVARTGLFNYKEIERIKREHFDGVRNHRQKLWTLLVLQVWFDTWTSR